MRGAVAHLVSPPLLPSFLSTIAAAFVSFQPSSHLSAPSFLSTIAATFVSFQPSSHLSAPSCPIINPSRRPRSTPASFSSPSPFLSTRHLQMHQSLPRAKAFCSSANNNNGVVDQREILVQHLLVAENNSNLILDLQHKISAGVDLSDLALEHSICPSREDGGMLGWVKKGQMVPEFEEAAFSAPLNKVIKCKTQFGWHLLQVLSEREGSLLLNIEPEELHSKIHSPSFVEEAQLIDVREPDEVAIASLPGFKVLPLRQFGIWGPGVTDELNQQKDTYVLCHHGARSLQVAKWLLTQGFKRVYNVAGGIHAYALKDHLAETSHGNVVL